MSKIPEDSTVVDLIKRAREEHQKKEKEVQKLEDENRKRIIAMVEKESELRKKIETAKERISKMEDEFEGLEKERMKANLEEIKKNEVTKRDVQEGKASIHQFYAQGKEEDEIRRMTEAKTLEDLEKVSDAIRAKRAEIIELEIELCDIQNSIYGLTINPGKLLKEKYKQLSEWLDFQLSPLMEGWNSAKSRKIEMENQRHLTKETGLSTGYRWDSITKKEARRLIHDPKLPKRHIPSLLEQLDEVEGENTVVSVIYHLEGRFWPGLPVEVHQSYEPGETIKSDRIGK